MYAPAITADAAPFRKRNRACAQASTNARGAFSKKLVRGLICGARCCAHNMSGACNAGIVNVGEAILRENCGPHCETFTLREDPANTLRGFFGAKNLSSAEHGAIACAMIRCVHNDHNLCTADAVHMLAPHPAESAFVPCGSYVKK